MAGSLIGSSGARGNLCGPWNNCSVIEKRRALGLWNSRLTTETEDTNITEGASRYGEDRAKSTRLRVAWKTPWKPKSGRLKLTGHAVYQVLQRSVNNGKRKQYYEPLWMMWVTDSWICRNMLEIVIGASGGVRAHLFVEVLA